jgi:Patatin-like phospholipase
MTPDAPTTSFEEVFTRELEDVKRRQGQTVTPAGAPFKSQEALRREALDLDMVGLALSGGGIRSATFCLGILQGLAELGLLRRLDYLSTVSGGGFIGGWLTAWIKREGDVANVEMQLKPNRIEQRGAVRLTGDKQRETRVLDEEPEPIRHLRAYSNYLAPRPSLFSADGWVLIAIYLRNLLLNQVVFLVTSVVLVLCVLAIVQVAAIIAYTPDVQAWNVKDLREQRMYAGAGATINALGSPIAGAIVSSQADLPPVWRGGSSPLPNHVRDPLCYWIFYGILAVLLGVACWNIYLSTEKIAEADWAAQTKTDLHADPPRLRTEKRLFRQRILLPLVSAACCAALFSLYHFGPLPTERLSQLGERDRLRDVLAVACFFMIVYGVLHLPSLELSRSLKRLGDPAQRPARSELAKQIGLYILRIVFAVVIAGIGGALFYAAVFLLHMEICSEGAALEDFWVPSVVTLCPPMLLAVLVLIGFVQTGFEGQGLTEAQREWRSSLGGYLLALAVGWFALFGVVLFGPWLWYRLDESLQTWGPALLTAIWSSVVGGGVLAAWSPLTGSDRSSDRPGGWRLEILAKAAPFVFLAGVLVLIVVLAASIVSGFQIHNAQDYIQRIDSANALELSGVLKGPSTPAALNKLGLFMFFAPVGFVFACLLSWRFNINIFSMNGLYANRLIRCYLGASRRKRVESTRERPPGAGMNVVGPDRNPNAVTGFDPNDDLKLCQLQTAAEMPDLDRKETERGYRGPIHLICTALNLVQGEELAWQERKAESFVLTPRYCGGSTTAYRPTETYSAGLSLGHAMSISGAAVSPNWGFYSTPSVTALLTLFNARLGAWLGNPRKKTWMDFGPRLGLLYLLKEMLGRTNDHSDYVYISDGGHFEDLGVYELIRRRCRFIVACDGGADPNFSLQDLGNMIRKVRIDFGVRIEIDVEALRAVGDEKRSGSHVAVGKILYGDVDCTAASAAKKDPDPLFRPENEEGVFVYIKAALTGDEPPDLLNYAAEHPDFPNQTTLDQFFTESQFESYRALGYHSATAALENATLYCSATASGYNRELFREIYELWCPPPPDFTETYLESNKDYLAVQDALRTDPRLRFLSAELNPETAGNKELLRDRAEERVGTIINAERHMVLRMLTVLEDAWFGLHLDRYQQAPYHNGWMEIYHRWLSLPAVIAHWPDVKKEFSQVFWKAAERLEPALTKPKGP